MENLTLESFKEKIMDFETIKEDWKFQGELPAILKFSASWCKPCKTLNPILEELSNDYKGKLDIYEIDVENEPELSSMFGIRSVPSMLFIPKEGEPQMTLGALPKHKLVETINEVFFLNE